MKMQTDARACPDFPNIETACGIVERHGELVSRTLPLLGQDWRNGRLAIETEGASVLRAEAAGSKQTRLVLVDGADSSLRQGGRGRYMLTYSPRSMEGACAAILALGAGEEAPIAADPESLSLLTLAQRIANSDVPVLIEGPTGTGKEVFARFIHGRSSRANAPFVAVNCAAMPDAMLEGLLFGHRKGAFTGAAEAREGLFQAAHGGTLLLDEIGELPLSLQAKLLRVLQEGEVLPLGATRPVPVDVRIVACTNRALAHEVAAGRFREDLLYRLNIFPLELPALRERVEDVAPLAFGMLIKHGCKARGPAWLSNEALALLKGHSWPGNVRELENVIRRALLLADGADTIDAEHILFDRKVRLLDGDGGDANEPAHIGKGPASAARGLETRGRETDDDGATLPAIAFRSQAEAINAALQQNGGHRGQTAKSLGISERTLRYRLASMRETGFAVAGRGA
jgi:two-component system response regulator FlrC